MRRETPSVGLREWFLQAETGRSRVLMAVATGAVVAFVVAWFAPWQLTVLVGWDVVAVSIVGTVWLAIGPSPLMRHETSRSARTARGRRRTSCSSAPRS